RYASNKIHTRARARVAATHNRHPDGAMNMLKRIEENVQSLARLLQAAQEYNLQTVVRLVVARSVYGGSVNIWRGWLRADTHMVLARCRIHRGAPALGREI